jgi:putative phosphoesterase
MLVGVISDTHGLLRPAALAALRPAAMVIHAGDIGKPAILEALRDIGPLSAVRGNIETQCWAAGLPEQTVVTAGNHKILVLHDVSQLTVDPVAAGLAAIVFGHSHKPSVEERAGVLYLNPGSAGPRRFRLPVTLAYLHVTPKSLRAEIIPLPVS